MINIIRPLLTPGLDTLLYILMHCPKALDPSRRCNLSIGESLDQHLCHKQLATNHCQLIRHGIGIAVELDLHTGHDHPQQQFSRLATKNLYSGSQCRFVLAAYDTPVPPGDTWPHAGQVE